MPDLAVGSIQQSVLSESQFQDLMGTTNWVLADGQNVNGSQYASLTGNSSVPDFRGCFIRMAGGKADSIAVKQQPAVNTSNANIQATTEVGGTTVSVGGTSVTTSGNSSQLNSKGYSNYSNIAATLTYYQGSAGTEYQAAPSDNWSLVHTSDPETYQAVNSNSTANVSHQHYTLGLSGTFSMSGTTTTGTRATATGTSIGSFTGGGVETRPKNVAMNFFIKIN